MLPRELFWPISGKKGEKQSSIVTMYVKMISEAYLGPCETDPEFFAKTVPFIDVWQ